MRKELFAFFIGWMLATSIDQGVALTLLAIGSVVGFVVGIIFGHHLPPL